METTVTRVYEEMWGVYKYEIKLFFWIFAFFGF